MSRDHTPRTGRNDPCPCGSGRKYKHCCLEREESLESLWFRQNAEFRELSHDAFSFAFEKFASRVEKAWKDFHLGQPDEPFDLTLPENSIFIPYFLFLWDPKEIEGRQLPGGGLIARAYKRAAANRLTGLHRQLLKQVTDQPLSFLEVLAVQAGKGMRVRDVLAGFETDVIEHAGSQEVKRGDILYGQLCLLPGITIFGCLAPFAIPPRYKSEVVKLRTALREGAEEHRYLAPEALRLHAALIRDTYFFIRDVLTAPPQLQNTDGDPLMFHTITYRVESAQKSFDALAPLARGVPKKELLLNAEFDDKGELRKVKFEWLKKGNRKHPTWESTVLGSIWISDQSLIAEANSEKRAQRLRAEIEKRMGAAAKLERIEAQTLDQMLRMAPPKERRKEKAKNAGQEGPLRDPEVKRRMQEHLQREAEAWVYQKVPALGNRTPFEAVQDPDGREIVESLLLDFERRPAEGAFPEGVRPDLETVRRLLNLNPPL